MNPSVFHTRFLCLHARLNSLASRHGKQRLGVIIVKNVIKKNQNAILFLSFVLSQWLMIQDFSGKWMFCPILVFHVRDMLSSRLISDIYTLFQMVLDCLRVVVDVFEVVVDGCRWLLNFLRWLQVVVGGCRWFQVVLGGFRSFHVLVTTAKYPCRFRLRSWIFVLSRNHAFGQAKSLRIFPFQETFLMEL